MKERERKKEIRIKKREREKDERERSRGGVPKDNRKPKKVEVRARRGIMHNRQ